MQKIFNLLLVLTLTACLEYSDAAIRQPATLTPTKQGNNIVTLTPAPTENSSNIGTIFTCTVTAESLHVRSGGGVSYPVIGYLYAGEIVTVETQRGQWLNIGQGWVHSKYCER